MATHVELRWTAGADVAVVGPLTGRAELAVAGTDAASAVALVDALLRPGQGALEPGSAARLAVADRDRLLVAVHLDRYGPVIATTLTCRGCGERFDLDFRLDELAGHCEPAGGSGPDEIEPERLWRVGDLEFRPLTGEDELSVLGERDLAGALFRRVTTAGTGADDVRRDVAAALARLTPPVAAPIGATCPECGAQQAADFDVQSFLLARVLGERARLWRGVHLIASTYHWSRAEILDLGQEEREAYAEAAAELARRVRVR